MYISLFERLVAALWKGHMKSAEIVEEKHMAEDGEIDLLRLRILDMQAKLDAADQAKYGLEECIVAAELNSKTLESEVEQLRAALVQEVQSAESEVQRRQDEEAEIEKIVAGREAEQGEENCSLWPGL